MRLGHRLDLQPVHLVAPGLVEVRARGGIRRRREGLREVGAGRPEVESHRQRALGYAVRLAAHERAVDAPLDAVRPPADLEHVPLARVEARHDRIDRRARAADRLGRVDVGQDPAGPDLVREQLEVDLVARGALVARRRGRADPIQEERRVEAGARGRDDPHAGRDGEASPLGRRELRLRHDLRAPEREPARVEGGERKLQRTADAREREVGRADLGAPVVGSAALRLTPPGGVEPAAREVVAQQQLGSRPWRAQRGRQEREREGGSAHRDHRLRVCRSGRQGAIRWRTDGLRRPRASARGWRGGGPGQRRCADAP